MGTFLFMTIRIINFPALGSAGHSLACSYYLTFTLQYNDDLRCLHLFDKAVPLTRKQISAWESLRCIYHHFLLILHLPFLLLTWQVAESEQHEGRASAGNGHVEGREAGK